MDHRPHVCLLTSVHPLYDIRIFYKQAKSLAAAGYSVTLIAQHDASSPFETEGVRVIPLRRPRNRKERMLKTVWQLWRQALQQKADVYHFHDPELLFVGVLLKLRGHSVIYDIHENVAEQMLTKRWLPFRRSISRLYRWLEIGLCRMFPLVLAEASYDKLYPERCNKIVVQNFPELGLFPAALENRDSSRRVVYVGGVSRLRGIDVVLDALGMLNQMGVGFHFDCIGEVSPSYRQQLEAYCSRLGIADHVTFHGRMKATEAYEIVSQGAVGLAILQPSPNYLESFPTKMFEYMALRIPVITSHFPLYVQTVQEAECGITLDPEDSTAVAGAIAYMLEHPEEARRMGDNGRRAVETKFNWSQENAKLLQLYQDLLTLKESG